MTLMSLWAMLAAPLIVGNDLRHMTPETLKILTNHDVIAVDQDPRKFLQGGAALMTLSLVRPGISRAQTSAPKSGERPFQSKR